MIVVPSDKPEAREYIEYRFLLNQSNMNSDSGNADVNGAKFSETENIKTDISVSDKSSVETCDFTPEPAPQEDNKMEVDDMQKDNTDNGPVETCVEDSNGAAFNDAMIEKLKDNVNPDIDGEINLLESADDVLLNSNDKECEMECAKDQESDVIKSEKTEALNLFIQGKRNMVVGDYESAVDALGQACDKLKSVYGELAEECGEAYFNYGTALLELWKEEEGQKKEDDDVEQANGVSNGLDESETENGVINGENEEIENDEGKEGEGAVENEGEEENKNEEGEDLEEEADNLQIAWEVLEIAKTIYSETKDDMKLATIYTKLGEISIASGNFDLAIEDLKRTLEIESKCQSIEARVIANTHFQLFFAYSGNCNFDEALRHLRTAKSTFESLLDKYEKSDASDKEKSDAVKELTEIIREIDEKISESHKDQRAFMSEVAQLLKCEVENQNHQPVSSSSVTVPSSNFSPLKCGVPINNISHLVRKKPKVTFEETKNDPKIHANGDCPTVTVKEVNGAIKSSKITADSQSNKPNADDKELENISKKNEINGTDESSEVASDAQSENNTATNDEKSTTKKNETINDTNESSKVAHNVQSDKNKEDDEDLKRNETINTNESSEVSSNTQSGKHKEVDERSTLMKSEIINDTNASSEVALDVHSDKKKIADQEDSIPKKNENISNTNEIPKVAPDSQSDKHKEINEEEKIPKKNENVSDTNKLPEVVPDSQPGKLKGTEEEGSAVKKNVTVNDTNESSEFPADSQSDKHKGTDEEESTVKRNETINDTNESSEVPADSQLDKHKGIDEEESTVKKNKTIATDESSEVLADSQFDKLKGTDEEESTVRKNETINNTNESSDVPADFQSDKHKVVDEETSTPTENETNGIKESSEVSIDSQSNKRKADDEESESLPKKVCLNKND